MKKLKRTVMFAMKFTPGEKRLLEKKADAAGMSMSEYTRFKLFGKERFANEDHPIA